MDVNENVNATAKVNVASLSSQDVNEKEENITTPLDTIKSADIMIKQDLTPEKLVNGKATEASITKKMTNGVNSDKKETPEVKKPAKLPTSVVTTGLAGPKSPSKTLAPQTFVPKVSPSEPIKIGFGMLKSRPKSEPVPVKKKKSSRPKPPPTDSTDGTVSKTKKAGIFVQSQITAEVIKKPALVNGSSKTPVETKSSVDKTDQSKITNTEVISSSSQKTDEKHTNVNDTQICQDSNIEPCEVTSQNSHMIPTINSNSSVESNVNDNRDTHVALTSQKLSENQSIRAENSQVFITSPPVNPNLKPDDTIITVTGEVQNIQTSSNETHKKQVSKIEKQFIQENSIKSEIDDIIATATIAAEKISIKSEIDDIINEAANKVEQISIKSEVDDIIATATTAAEKISIKSEIDDIINEAASQVEKISIKSEIDEIINAASVAAGRISIKSDVDKIIDTVVIEAENISKKSEINKINGTTSDAAGRISIKSDVDKIIDTAAIDHKNISKQSEINKIVETTSDAVGKIPIKSEMDKIINSTANIAEKTTMQPEIDEIINGSVNLTKNISIKSELNEIIKTAVNLAENVCIKSEIENGIVTTATSIKNISEKQPQSKSNLEFEKSSETEISLVENSIDKIVILEKSEISSEAKLTAVEFASDKIYPVEKCKLLESRVAQQAGNEQSDICAIKGTVITEQEVPIIKADMKSEGRDATVTLDDTTIKATPDVAKPMTNGNVSTLVKIEATSSKSPEKILGQLRNTKSAIDKFSDARIKLAREKTPDIITHSKSEASISFKKSLENVRSLTSAVLEQSKSPSGYSNKLKQRYNETRTVETKREEHQNKQVTADRLSSPDWEEHSRPISRDATFSRRSSTSPVTSMYSARSSPELESFSQANVEFAPLNVEVEPFMLPVVEAVPFEPPPLQPPSNRGFGVVCANTGRKLDVDRYRTEVEVFFRAGALAQLESQRDERLQDHVTRLQARCRGYLARRRFAKRKVQEVAVQCIQRNVRRFLQVRDWPWWRLLVRVAPLLNVHRAEEELKTKTEELETLRARLEKVETERTRLKQDTDRLEARLSELSVALSEEHSAATLASERLEAETSERIRLQQELEHVQVRHGELQQASERLEMELLFCRAADMNGSATLSSTTTEDEGDADTDGPAAQAVAHLRQRLERANRELALSKRRLTQQHEDDLEQMLALKKMMEKKIADAYEEVEEQRQVAAQWKRKAQRITSEGNDSRLLLEEQSARNALLEKRQRKFDSELQQLQEALRQEKNQRERATRERDMMAAEKSAVEQTLAACRLELEMREEKVGSLSRELEELQFGGAAEEEVAALRKSRHALDIKLKEQEEELDDLAGQVSLLEQAKLRLEMSLEQTRKEMRRELGQRDEELEEARCNAQKKVKALECQLETEHEERTRLLREKHELERRLAEVSELARGRAPEDEQAIARLRRDLRHTKALLRDAHTMLEKYKSEAPGKGQIRQLRHQLEDAEFARTAALRAKQAAETELRETQASLEEMTRARGDAEDRAAQAIRERTEARGQLEENEEEMAEVLRKYRAAVAQVSQEQAAMQEATAQMSALEAERNSLKEQLAELTARVESAEGEHASSLTQRRLEMRVRELESRLELEQTTRARLETQISRLKDSVEKLQAEGDAARAREAAAQDNARRLQRQLREAREAEATQGTREADWARRRKELELRAEAAEAEASTARTDLRLALQRVEDLQAAMAGELNSSASGTEESEGESDSDESIESFLLQHKGSLRSSHVDTLELDFSCRSPEGQSDPGCTLSEDISKANESHA